MTVPDSKASRVLVLAKAYPPVVGGVETYSEEIVRAYMRQGYRVTVLTQTAGASGWRRLKYAEGGASLFNTGPGRQWQVFCRLIAAVRRLRRERRFSFMHATTWRPALALVPTARRGPTVITVHGREVMNYPLYLGRAMVTLLRRATVVVTVSRATMEVARNAIGDRRSVGKWIVAFNGISFRDEALIQAPKSSRGGNRVRLFSIARLVPRKNIQGCIAALGELRKEGVDQFEYWIGGTGPMEAELKEAVRTWGLDDCVKFLGYVDDEALPKLYRAADVFLHPQTNVGEGNDFEGFGLVIADAMSFGAVVLAGNAGGPRDFVQDRQNGLLVDGLDQAALKASIRELLVNSALRARLSSAGRSFALRELSWDRHVSAVISAVTS